jgi:hypothetical protein
MTSLASAAQGDASLSLAALESDIAAGREISFPVKYNYYFEDNYGNSTDVGLEDGFVTLSKSTFGFQVTKGYKQSFAIPPEKILELAQQPQQASRLKVKVAIKSVRGNKEIKQDYYFYGSGASAVEGGPISCGDCSDSMDALYTLLTKVRAGQWVRIEDAPAVPPAPAPEAKTAALESLLMNSYGSLNGEQNALSAAKLRLQANPNDENAIFTAVELEIAECNRGGDAQTCNDAATLGQRGLSIPQPSVYTDDNWRATIGVTYPYYRWAVALARPVPPAAAPAPAPAPAPMPDIAPPPPPPDSPPPTIALGQTKDQVTAAFGQPVRIAKLGVKEIFYYKDMRVTFTNGKVSNVE